MAIVAFVPLVASCILTTEDPDAFGPRTEANVLDGCVSAQDPTYQGLIVVGTEDSGDDAADVVVIPDEVPAELLDPCVCFYEGVEEEFSFAEWDRLERSLRDLPDPADAADADDAPADSADEDSSDDELGELRATYFEIAQRCFPPR